MNLNNLLPTELLADIMLERFQVRLASESINVL